MKLLRLKINSEAGFRSLKKGFEVCFHQESDFEGMTSFSPFCLVGLNGCGKSNVLEALSQIFYHIELCVGSHLPQTIKNGESFDSEKCVIDAFELEYLVSDSVESELNKRDIFKVCIIKEENKEPKMYKVSAYGDKSKRIQIPLKSLSEGKALYAKKYLPQYIVAYSSGENETLSIPFIKSRFIHLFEFKDAIVNNIKDYSSPENSLIYVDSNMSQAILLSCLLFESDLTLKSLASYYNTGILNIKRFRIYLREEFFNDNTESFFKFFKLQDGLFDKLESCSTLSWYDKDNKVYYFDFWVNDATKQAFKNNFHSAMECFQVFRLLYELNNYIVSSEKEAEVFYSKGVYTEEKLPVAGADNDIFHFLDFYITKQIDAHGHTEELLLRQFSDGEHQFIHTMAICLLLKDSESLILLDEPETHFNPSWRSRFISILDETLRNGCNGLSHTSDYINFVKEILITSHSPFIISDCNSKNVLILDKDDKGHTRTERAIDRNIKTYGASIGYISAKIFDNTDTIGGKAYSEMQAMSQRTDLDKQQLMEEISDSFGDSLEKLKILSSVNSR